MKPTHSIEAYIQAVQNNIRWKRARKIATQDLEQHIQDQFDAYVNQGMDSDPALEEAIKSMGDPQKIGKELDCAYRPTQNRIWQYFKLYSQSKYFWGNQFYSGQSGF